MSRSVSLWRSVPLVALFALLVQSAPIPASAADHTRDSLTTVKEKIAEKQAVLIDVREESEWNEGHVAGAVHLPLSGLNDALSPEQQERLSKDKILYLHCKSGRRCLSAGDILEKKGYQVRCLKPGYADLIEAGFPKAEK